MIQKWGVLVLKLNLADPDFDRFDNVENLHNLIEYIKGKRIIPFIGAGMSNAIYGFWGSALEQMMKGHFSGKKTEAETIIKLIGNGEYEQAAEDICNALTLPTFQNRLVAIFKETHIKDDTLKTMAVRYLPRIFQDSLAVTTNFDKVLERIFLMEQYSFTEKIVLRHLTPWQAKYMMKSGIHYLIKIHGCVSAPDEVVMTKESYDDLYQDGSPHIERLCKILEAHFLLFIGCSLKEDRTVGLLREVGRGGHYAILPMDGEDGSDAFEARKRFMASKLDMNCIWYPEGEHHYVEDILEYIYADITGQLRASETAVPEASSVVQITAPGETEKKVESSISKVPTCRRSPDSGEIKKSVTTSLAAVKPLIKNEIFTMGRWNDDPFEWLILDVQPGRALLIANDCLITAPYNEKLQNITWAECSLRNKVLPDLMDQVFDIKERNKVMPWHNRNSDNATFNIPGGVDTTDNLFLLSIDEAKQYFPYNKARVAYMNGDAMWWWLRSPGFESFDAADVDSGGYVLGGGRLVSLSAGAVRPAFWLNLQS